MKLAIKLAIVLALVVGGIVTVIADKPIAKEWRHHCDWEHSDSLGNSLPCRYDSLTHDEFFSHYDEGTDAYIFELNHFNNPDWSEDKCEDAIWYDSKHKSHTTLMDYQVLILNDSTLALYDSNRLVSYLPFRDEDDLSLAIIHDNE